MRRSTLIHTSLFAIPSLATLAVAAILGPDLLGASVSTGALSERTVASASQVSLESGAAESRDLRPGGQAGTGNSAPGHEPAAETSSRSQPPEASQDENLRGEGGAMGLGRPPVGGPASRRGWPAVPPLTSAATSNAQRSSSLAPELTGERRVAGEEEPEEVADEDDEDREDDEVPELGPTVDTPISGKVMSRQTNQGISGVAITVLIFHPLSSLPGAPQWVTLASATTDASGLFGLVVAVPERPAPGAVLALSFDANGHEPLAGAPVLRLTPGQPNTLGVYWLHGESWRVEGTIEPAHLAEGSQLVDTGALNPLSWDPRVRPLVLSTFRPRPVSGELFELRLPRQVAELEGQRRVGLLSASGALLGVRDLSWKAVRIEGEDGGEREEVVGTLNFALGSDLSRGGSVMTSAGGSLEGAVVTTVSAQREPAQTCLCTANGQFRFASPPKGLIAWRVSHPSYLTKEVPAERGEDHQLITLSEPRPNIPLRLSDALTGEPVTAARITLLGAAPASGPAPSLVVDLSSPTGDGELSAEWPIAELVIEAEGFFVKRLAQPPNNPADRVEVLLERARVLEFTAREAVAQSERWNAHDDASMMTYYGRTWLEFDVDYGADLSAFVLDLGVRNFGLIDHSYEFEVAVTLSGEAVGAMSILADEAETRTGRLTLPPATGRQRLRITWLNDRWIPDQLDANIIIDALRLQQRPLPEAPTEAQ